MVFQFDSICWLFRFPYWLINKDVKLRTNDTNYLNYVDRYFDQLIPLLVPLQYSNGGPIIDFQIEDDTDTDIDTATTQIYYGYLRDGLRKRGVTTLINTLAFPTPGEISAALIDGVWEALEFPYWTPLDVAFDLYRW